MPARRSLSGRWRSDAVILDLICATCEFDLGVRETTNRAADGLLEGVAFGLGRCAAHGGAERNDS
jgi:hypothetical protein